MVFPLLLDKRGAGVSDSAGAGAAAAPWTPDSPTTDGEVSPHTYFDLETGLFQDSAETTPVTAGDDPVGSEVNQGSDSYSVVQATADNRPLYKTGILNGKPMLLFDGTNDSLQGAYGGGALTQPFTVFVIGKLDASVVNDGSQRRIIGSGTTSPIILYQTPTPTPDGWGMFAGTLITGGDSDSDWNIWCALFNGASSELWLNGISEVSGDAGANAPTQLAVGSGNASFGPWKGYIGKRLIYPGNISTADKNQVGQYLADFYGRTWTAINP